MAETDGVQWHITSQEQTTTIAANARGFQDVWEVGYRIDSGPATGTTGMIKVPVEQYGANVVKAAIDAQVGHLHAIGGL